jgi:hypothetical protein
MHASTSSRAGKAGRRAVTALMAVLLVGVLASPASARIVERDRYSGTYGFTFDDCGFEIDVDGSYWGHYRIREGRAEATATPFYLHDRNSWEETLTAENGTTLTIQSNQVINEIRARYLGDAVFEFDRLAAGQTRVYDADGNLLFRDRGMALFTYSFDKQEHPREPGGEFLELVDVQVRGPHPFDLLPEDEFCALFE